MVYFLVSANLSALRSVVMNFGLEVPMRDAFLHGGVGWGKA